MKHSLCALVNAAMLALASPAFVALSERPARADDPERRNPDPLLYGTPAPTASGNTSRIVSFSQLPRPVQEAIAIYNHPSQASYNNFRFNFTAAVNPVTREITYQLQATYHGSAHATDGVKAVFVLCGIQPNTDPARTRPFVATCLDGMAPQEFISAGPIQPGAPYAKTVTRQIRPMLHSSFDSMPFYAPHVDLHFPSGSHANPAKPPHVGVLLERVQMDVPDAPKSGGQN